LIIRLTSLNRGNESCYEFRVAAVVALSVIGRVLAGAAGNACFEKNETEGGIKLTV